jgi:hypothetical protein
LEVLLSRWEALRDAGGKRAAGRCYFAFADERASFPARRYINHAHFGRWPRASSPSLCKRLAAISREKPAPQSAAERLWSPTVV